MRQASLICPPAGHARINDGAGVAVGCSSPLGATVVPGGVNFSILTRNASRVELVLFDQADDARPARVIEIEAATNRTLDYWHAFVAGIKSGQLYGYRIHGPFDPQSGMRFDSGKLLLDPYGLGVAVPANYNRTIATIPGDNTAVAVNSAVLATHPYHSQRHPPLPPPPSP